MEDRSTRLYHSPDLKPVFLKNGDQRTLNPLSILTFDSLTVELKMLVD